MAHRLGSDQSPVNPRGGPHGMPKQRVNAAFRLPRRDAEDRLDQLENDLHEEQVEQVSEDHKLRTPSSFHDLSRSPHGEQPTINLATMTPGHEAFRLRLAL